WSVPGAGSRCLALAPDGSWMAVGQRNQLVLQTFAPTSEDVFDVPGWQGVKGVAVSLDGRSVALALEGRTGWNRPGGVRTFDVKARAFGPVDGTHSQPVHCVAFTPDGRYVVSGGVDRSVRFWDREKGHLACTLLWHLGGVQTIEFSPDGHTMA